MKKLLLTSVAVVALLASPAIGQTTVTTTNNADAAIGGTAGAAAGGALGFLVGGPIGAIVGGFSGAVLGAGASVPEQTIVYAGNNPVEPVYIESGLQVGATVPQSVTIYPVESDPQHGYIYANDRVFIVDNTNRQIVYSPGYTIPQAAVAYVENNPMQSVEINGSLDVGTTLSGSINVASVPEYPHYGYVYVNGQPALVDLGSRTVIWVR